MPLGSPLFGKKPTSLGKPTDDPWAESVRSDLLKDPTIGPALQAAQQRYGSIFGSNPGQITPQFRTGEFDPTSAIFEFRSGKGKLNITPRTSPGDTIRVGDSVEQDPNGKKPGDWVGGFEVSDAHGDQKAAQNELRADIASGILAWAGGGLASGAFTAAAPASTAAAPASTAAAPASTAAAPAATTTGTMVESGAPAYSGAGSQAPGALSPFSSVGGGAYGQPLAGSSPGFFSSLASGGKEGGRALLAEAKAKPFTTAVQAVSLGSTVKAALTPSVKADRGNTGPSPQDAALLASQRIEADRRRRGLLGRALLRSSFSPGSPLGSSGAGGNALLGQSA
jgi:hypothetical protein